MPQKFRRLSPKELTKLGLLPTSRRYVRAATKTISKRTKTISHRAYETKKIRQVFGQKLTREQVTQRRQSGEISYQTAASKQNAFLRKEYSRIRAGLRDSNDLDKLIPLSDVKLIYKKQTTAWEHFSEEEKQRWKELFKEYDRKNVLTALGHLPSLETFVKMAA